MYTMIFTLGHIVEEDNLVPSKNEMFLQCSLNVRGWNWVTERQKINLCVIL